MKKILPLLLFLFTSAFVFAQKNKPNIILIYADDLGYGDISAYKKGTLNTPNMDKLTNGGVRFTNGYSTSATCTPSRLALLTGNYPWKNDQAKILQGDAPLLIDTSMITVPKMLKKSTIQNPMGS